MDIVRLINGVEVGSHVLVACSFLSDFANHYAGNGDLSCHFHNLEHIPIELLEEIRALFIKSLVHLHQGRDKTRFCSKAGINCPIKDFFP